MKECPACRCCFPDEINHCPQDGDATLPSLHGEPILDARYQLERRLGQGGMGVVFQARHIFLKTAHAIKIILPDLVGNDPMLVTRFRQEALAAAAIRHQNIISVTDFGVVRGTMPFLVMEFVKGKSLQEIMAKEGAMPAARAYELICPAAAGVAAAHRQNIVHRDLKPLNIMIQDNIPVSEGLKILDFGLAKIKSSDLLGSFVQAKTSGLMGSPFYMAPEQWSDEEPDARADIYSLGIIFYQMLAGDVPFKGSSIPSIMKKHLTLPVPTFRAAGVQVPPAIEAVVRHALEKEVSARTPSVEAFLDELRAAVNSTSATLRSKSESATIDPNKTFASAPSANPPPAAMTHPTGLQTNFDPLAGTVSSSALDEQLQEQLSATGEAFRREQQEKQRFARQELAREAEARKGVEQEAARKRREEEEERLRKEQAEREQRERQQREQLERVSRQAEELEEKLARLAISMPPPTTAAVIDPEATQLQQRAVTTQAVGNNSFASATQAGRQDSTVAIPGAPSRTRSSSSLMVVVIVLALLAGGGIGGYFYLRPKQVVNNNGTNGTTTTTTAAIKPDLIEIPGGAFQMGRNNGPPQETPAHQVSVQSFFVDKTEVTNAEYAEFVRETNHTPPSHWNGTKPSFGQESWPVVNVSFEDANAFAGWRSKRDGVSYRLPTESEWEYAARNGESNDLYPWGKDWKEKQAVLKEATPSTVGTHPAGNSKWGVADLLGNVWEWTSSKVSAYPGNPVTIPTSTQDWITIRGGSYASDPADKDNPVSSCMRTFVPPSTKTTLLGFRLVRSAH
jgi:formylglycine-generating enzyme required for sulfatase activity/serine/threonine protein kinase